MIGVFDSGLGGLSVLNALANKLPDEDLVYLADQVNLPYGNKSVDFIQKRVLEVGNHLYDMGCRVLVVACNTATTVAVKALRAHLSQIPVVGVEPAIKPAVQSSQAKKVVILATELTAKSERLKTLIAMHASDCEVQVIACHHWATYVESCDLKNNAIFLDDIKRVVNQIEASQSDQVVLGCTHYAFMVPMMRQYLTRDACLWSVAEPVAAQVARQLRCAPDQRAGAGLLKMITTGNGDNLLQALRYYGLDCLAKKMPNQSLERWVNQT